jgi:hypothetical protein
VTTREAVYRLIDELSDADLDTVHAYLVRLRERSTPALPPVLANAPWDDEPETEEERAAVAAAEEDFRQGRVVSHAEARQRLLGGP